MSGIPEPLKGTGGGLAAKIKSRLASNIAELKKTHRSKLSGLEITRAYTGLIDSVLKELFHSIAAGKLRLTGDIALVALGGYGRAELNVRSDVDLMLLYGKTITPAIEELTQKILYVMWDAGMDVGFGIRNVSESVALARTDGKTKTSLLDMRLLYGDAALFGRLSDKVMKSCFTGRELKKFIEEKVEERKLRHEKYGDSVYILEPNVKEGEGGIRDFHTAAWIVKAQNAGIPEPLAGFLNQSEMSSLAASFDFLHWIRNELHFETGKKTDQLTFEHQERIAGLSISGFSDSHFVKGVMPHVEGIMPHELAVESFMRKYYLHASNVKNLSDIIISRSLPKKRGIMPLSRHILQRRRGIDKNFFIKGSVLYAEDNAIFKLNPVLMMKAFEHSSVFNADIDQGVQDGILENLNLVDDSLRASPEAGAGFVKILEGSAPYRTLSEMHRLKFLGSYIPEFDSITCKVQHDLYHVYTVDTHSLFAVRELERLHGHDALHRAAHKKGHDALHKGHDALHKGHDALHKGHDAFHREFSLHSELFEEIGDNKKALVLSVLLHDIGKATGKGHAEKGGNLVPLICRRLKFKEEDAQTVSFLVKNHLILADTAQHRDLHDEKLVIEFAKKVGDTERLKLLYLLTFADVRAVGPEVWTRWKAALFQELYFKALGVLEKGTFEIEDAAIKISAIKEKVKKAVAAGIMPLVDEEVDNYFKLLPPRYFLGTSPEAIAGHIGIVRRINGEPCVITVKQVKEREYTEITVSTHDLHGLFSMITGVMAANSVNILGAQINTLTNGIALDVLQVNNAFGGLLTSEGKLKKIESDLSNVITGKVRVAALVEKIKTSILDKKIKPRVPTRIETDNVVSDAFTVIEIHTQDKIGLLYKISSTLTRAGLYIHVAKISTKGDEAADIFYTRDIFGQKITDEARLKKIEEALYEALGG